MVMQIKVVVDTSSLTMACLSAKQPCLYIFITLIMFFRTHGFEIDIGFWIINAASNRT